MPDNNIPISMQQAPDSWKIVAYLLLIPVVGLGLYGTGRFLVATFILASSTTSTLYQLVCLPIIFFSIPFLSLGLPFTLVRDATETQTRNIIIACIALMLGVVLMTIFLPEWAAILWGIRF